MRLREKRAISCVILAAALYAVQSPVSKLLLQQLPPTYLAALLYLGAGLGVSILSLARRGRGAARAEQPLSHRELPPLRFFAALAIMLGGAYPAATD